MLPLTDAGVDTVGNGLFFPAESGGKLFSGRLFSRMETPGDTDELGTMTGYSCAAVPLPLPADPSPAKETDIAPDVRITRVKSVFRPKPAVGKTFIPNILLLLLLLPSISEFSCAKRILMR